MEFSRPVDAIPMESLQDWRRRQAADILQRLVDVASFGERPSEPTPAEIGWALAHVYGKEPIPLEQIFDGWRAY